MALTLIYRMCFFFLAIRVWKYKRIRNRRDCKNMTSEFAEKFAPMN